MDASQRNTLGVAFNNPRRDDFSPVETASDRVRYLHSRDTEEGRRGQFNRGGIDIPAMQSGGRSFAELLKELVHAAWRRRLLLLIPVVLMIPLSIVFASFAPREYTARILLVLQDAARDNPLAGRAQLERLSERISGFQALLTSDRVLSQALDDMGDRSTGRERELKLQRWRTNLAVNLVGIDFIEIRLNDREAEGLGAKLEAIKSRFMESLTASRILSSPELLKVVDPPQDPLFANRSRLLYVIFGVAASILLGVGLVWVSELLDRKIRAPDQMAAVAGIPLAAHLPTLVLTARQDKTTASGSRLHLRVARVLGILVLTMVLIVS